MKSRYIIIIAIVCLIVGSIIILNYLYERTLRRMLDRPPVGITYVEPENFEFPDNYGVCMGQGSRIFIRNPKTLRTRVIVSDLPFDSIEYVSTVDNGETFYFIGGGQKKEDDTNKRFLMKYISKELTEIASAFYLSIFSISPDNRFIAYVAREVPSNEWRLYLYDVNSHETLPLLEYVSLVPPIWISSDRMIFGHIKGIVSYDIATKQMNTIVPGRYYDPVLWKKEYLIFFKDDDPSVDSVYISKIDGSELKFFCKNQYIFGFPSISPDNKYLAFISRFLNLNNEIVNLHDLTPGVSLCVIDIENKTFTYYLSPKDLTWTGLNDRYETYPFQLSWSYFPATK